MTSWAYISHTKLSDIDGTPYIGAKAYFYDAGTTTPRTVYSDSALTVPRTQPVEADSSGKFPAIYVQAGVYKLKVTQSDDTLIYEQDNVDAGVASNVSGAVPIANGGTAGTTPATARANLGAASQTALDALSSSTATSLAGKANSSHTHVINDISDSGVVGKLSMAATTEAEGRTAIGATIDVLLPSQTGNSGKVLSTDGANAEWISNRPTTFAWAVVKGNVSGAAVIQGTSINITSITRVGVGQYDVVMATAAPNADHYGVLTTPSSPQALNGSVAVTTRTTTGFRLNFAGYSGGTFVNSDCDFTLKVEVA